MNDLFGTGSAKPQPKKPAKPAAVPAAPVRAAKPVASPSPDDYSAKDIEVLEGLEPVRRRPGR